MRLKKLLMISAVTVFMGYSSTAYAFTNCKLLFCLFQDPVSMATGLLAREWNRHTETIHYDVTNGIEKVKENIGQYKSDGKCGVSATGQTGCDLTTEEEGAAATEAAAEEASVIPDSTITLIKNSELDGSIVLDGGQDQTSQADDVVNNKSGDTFDKVRSNVVSYIFETDDTTVNADCTCSAGTGSDCSTSECAQTRQNDALYAASLGAAATADSYLQDIDANYTHLTNMVSEVNSSTIAGFVGDMGKLSVYASSAATDIMTLLTHDLRAQSYRNLMTSGVTPVDLSSLKGATQ